MGIAEGASSGSSDCTFAGGSSWGTTAALASVDGFRLTI
jgi:hypothetical protein